MLRRAECATQIAIRPDDGPLSSYIKYSILRNRLLGSPGLVSLFSSPLVPGVGASHDLIESVIKVAVGTPKCYQANHLSQLRLSYCDVTCQ